MNQRQLASVLFAAIGLFFLLSPLEEILMLAGTLIVWALDPEADAETVGQKLAIVATLTGSVLSLLCGVALVLLRNRVASLLFPPAPEPISSREVQAVALSVLGCYFAIQGLSRLARIERLDYGSVTQLALGVALFFGAKGLARLWSLGRSSTRQVDAGMLVLLVSTLAACAQPERDQVQDGYLTGGGGARLFYQVAGTGADTVMVIHGGPGAGIEDIRPDLKPLERKHVVIYYDQRGGGRSELPADTALLSAKLFVEDLEAVRRHFGVVRLNLVAHSFGAIIVARYAEVFPQHLERVVFLGATGPIRREAARYYQARSAGSDTMAARQSYATMVSLMEGSAPDPVKACRELDSLNRQLARSRGDFAEGKGSSCNMPPDAVRYYFRYTARVGPDAFGDWDFSRSLQRLAIPLLVIDGARAKDALPMNHAWLRAVPNARLLLIPDAGRAVHAERPDAVFNAMDEFFAGAWPSGARPRNQT